MAATLICSLLASGLRQQPEISGQITDAATHGGVRGVVVLDVRSRHQAVSDSAGRFRVRTELPTTLRLSRVGYATREITVMTSDIEIALTQSPRTLEGVTVT